MRSNGATSERARDDIDWRVLDYLRTNPWSTSKEIADGLRVVPQTIHKRLSADPPSSSADGEAERSGRPHPDSSAPAGDLRRYVDGDRGRPQRFALSERHGRLFAVDFGANHCRVAVCDLRREQLCEPQDKPFDVLGNPGGALDLAAKMVDAFRERFRIDATKVAGLVVGLPFALSPDMRPQTSSNWKNFDLPRMVRISFDERWPLLIESDAALGALAELDAAEREQHDRARQGGVSPLDLEPLSMIYVKWSSSITGSLIERGRLLRPRAGLAASFVHLPADSPSGAGPPCERCGRHCTVTEARLGRVFDDVESLGFSIEGVDTEQRAERLISLARRHPEVRDRLDQAARMLGRTLGHTANVLAPDRVVVGGAFMNNATSRTYEEVAGALGAGLEEVAMPRVAEALRLGGGTVTGQAAVAGGLVLGARRFAVPYLHGKLHKSAAKARGRQRTGFAPPG